MTLHCINKKSKSINNDHSKVIKLSHHRSSERMFGPERRCTASIKNQQASTKIMIPWRRCTASTKNQKSSTKIKKHQLISNWAPTEASKPMFKPEWRCTASTNNQKTSADIIKKLSSVIHHQRTFPPKLFQLKKRWLQKNSAKNLLGRNSTCLAGTLHQNILHWICMIPHRTIRGFPLNHQKKCLNLCDATLHQKIMHRPTKISVGRFLVGEFGRKILGGKTFGRNF